MKPKLPFEGAGIVEHNKNSTWKGGELWLADEQKTGYIEGNELRKKIPDTAYNACVLDYLLENPEEIPEDWKGKWIYFWGTIYRRPNGNLYVRCLGWSGEQWCSSYDWLDSDWDSDGPVAVSARPLEFNPLDKNLELRISELESKVASLLKVINV